MPDYRRNRVPGGTFFFTENLLDRRTDLLVTQIDILRNAVRRVRARAPFLIDAWVVLPDHMHNQPDAHFPRSWRFSVVSEPSGPDIFLSAQIYAHAKG
jgi:putative transposase